MKRKLTDKERLVQAAANALVRGAKLITVHGCAETKPEEAMCHFVAREALTSHPGASVVSGWCLERASTAANGQIRVVFDYHSLIQLPDGTLACPSHLPSEQLIFLPDAARAYDFDKAAAYNLATYTNFPRKDLFSKTVPPFTLAWSAPYRGYQMISTDERHSKWVAFGRSDPFGYMERLGLDPDSLPDLIMVSNVDEFTTSCRINLEAPADEILSHVRDAANLMERSAVKRPR
jgi:hypothetical protein